MRRLLLFFSAMTVGSLLVTSVQAHDPDVPELEVPEVSVIGENPVAASSQQFIPDKEILLQPQGRPADVLRLIPGFIPVEHSGGAGKADQYFLRGFDAVDLINSGGSRRLAADCEEGAKPARLNLIVSDAK